jgi:hypothetical protein
MSVEDWASVLIASGESTSKLYDLPLKLVIASLELCLLRSLANALEVGGYDTV